jgi:RNA recognition motif. (a.k.a. RRM, RBD, or RNP domain)
MPPANRGFGGGKRQREAERDRKKKDKQERLRRNRAMRGQGGDSDLATPELLPEVKLEDVVISVAAQPRRNTIGPVKLFVGGLSWNTTSEDLRTAFARFGALQEATVIMDRTTGRSRGFGFVSFENAADAVEAVKNMNGAELDGRTLKVNNAESR